MSSETPDEFALPQLNETLDFARRAIWDHDPIHTERIEWIRTIVRRTHETPDQPAIRRFVPRTDGEQASLEEQLDAIIVRNARGYLTTNAAAADVQRCLLLIGSLRADLISQAAQSITAKAAA